MGRQLHHRKKDDKYAVYSTITGDYVIDWKSKEEVEKEYLEDLINIAKADVKKYMNDVYKEVD